MKRSFLSRYGYERLVFLRVCTDVICSKKKICESKHKEPKCWFGTRDSFYLVEIKLETRGYYELFKQNTGMVIR